MVKEQKTCANTFGLIDGEFRIGVSYIDSKLEGINNKIKNMKRHTRRYEHQKFFELRILSMHEKNYTFLGRIIKTDDMASIKLKFRASTDANKEGSLYYQIIHDRMIRQMKTEFKIFSSEWNEKTACLVLTPNTERVYYLRSVQYRVYYALQKFEELFCQLKTQQFQDAISIDCLVASFQSQLTRTTLFNYMEKLIGIFQNNEQLRTAETYQTTLNSFMRYRGQCDLPLNELTSEILVNYQYYLKHHNISMNTISFYMKRLRACYNKAIEQELVESSRPFKHVYTGMDKTVKRAISLDCLKTIKKLDLTKNVARSYSRDIFLLSFYLRGMSFIDMAYLKKTDLKDGILTYQRKKTGQKLSVEWESCMQKLVEKYQQEDSPYLLSILSEKGEDPRKQYQRALSNINHNLKNLGKQIGLKAPLTMYVSRHTWASVARKMDIPLSVISEGLGHDNEVTTLIYLSTVGTEAVDNANKKIIKLL